MDQISEIKALLMNKLMSLKNTDGSNVFTLDQANGLIENTAKAGKLFEVAEMMGIKPMVVATFN